MAEATRLGELYVEDYRSSTVPERYSWCFAFDADIFIACPDRLKPMAMVLFYANTFKLSRDNFNNNCPLFVAVAVVIEPRE